MKQSGWGKYLHGETPTVDDLLTSGELWQIELRVGVGLDVGKWCAAEGKLFSVQAVTMSMDVGFLVGVSGAKLPADALLRLGGDGRAAAIHTVSCALSEPDYEAIAQAAPLPPRPHDTRSFLAVTVIHGQRGAW